MRRTSWLGALAAIALLQGCTAAGTRVGLAEPYPRTGTALRKQMDAAHGAGDRAGLSRAAVALATAGGTLGDDGFARIAPSLDPTVLKATRAPWLVNSGGDPVAALHARFRGNGDPRQSRTDTDGFAEVPAEYRLVEGVAWDATTKRLFAGTVIDGTLVYLEAGRWHQVPLGNPRSGLFGMAVDARRRLLWIATGTVPQVAVSGTRMSGLIAVDLDRLAVARRVPLPTGVAGAVGDVAVAADGTVYASATSGAVHRCRPGCAELDDLLPAGSFRSPQGLALSRDGSHLYVADYSSGLWIVRLHDGRVEPVAIDGPAMLEGIDGLIRVPGEDTLIAIQNGTRPRRIVKLLLDAGGKHARIGDRVIVAAEAGEPTLGTLGGGELLFVADGQWERHGPGGGLTDGKPARPTPIARMPTEDVIVTSR